MQELEGIVSQDEKRTKVGVAIPIMPAAKILNSQPIIIYNHFLPPFQLEI
jgi:hypothetical protein